MMAAQLMAHSAADQRPACVTLLCRKMNSSNDYTDGLDIVHEDGDGETDEAGEAANSAMAGANVGNATTLKSQNSVCPCGSMCCTA